MSEWLPEGMDSEGSGMSGSLVYIVRVNLNNQNACSLKNLFKH